MKLIDLINLKNSDIKYRIFSFPDGEIQIELNELDRKEEYYIKCRITCANDLFILIQLNDILTRQGIIWSLRINYLMSMRMDRVMSFNRPFSLKIIKEILNTFSCKSIGIFEPHNYKATHFTKCYGIPFNHNIDLSTDCVIFPDKGAEIRYNNGQFLNYITFSKKRDIETGKILEFEIIKENFVSEPERFIFIDDLCDGGGTFLGELEVLKKEYPDTKYCISIVHAVNLEGIKRLCNAFDEVHITNSYRNWEEIITSPKLFIHEV